MDDTLNTPLAYTDSDATRVQGHALHPRSDQWRLPLRRFVGPAYDLWPALSLLV